jgi:hypothetical protein
VYAVEVPDASRAIVSSQAWYSKMSGTAFQRTVTFRYPGDLVEGAMV